MPTHPLSDELAAEALAAFEANGRNKTHAAAALGLRRNTYCNRLDLALSRRLSVEMAIARVTTSRDGDGNVTATHTMETVDRGPGAPETLPGFVPVRRTIHRIGGEVVEDWERQERTDVARAEALGAAARAMAETLPRAEPVTPPAVTMAALCNLYTLTDSHVGMLAWRYEGGADWDLDIAERVLVNCFEAMIAAAPAAERCVVNQLGDFVHFDGLEAKTPTSGHILDGDGRFEKVVQVAVRVLRRVVNSALAKHARVHVIMAEGNHDIASSVWLRTLFAALYENEPRVTVEQSPLPYYAMQHGKTMLAFHHGHLKKNDQLPILFASQFPGMWGETTKRICHTGHRHHVEIKEHSGMTVVQHPTLAARDAYAARGGWHAERKATAYSYHVEHGEVGSVTITPEMVA